MKPFQVIFPSKPLVPILVTLPHSGTFFPENLKCQYKKEYTKAPDDTDWYVDRLYDFVPDMGVTMIKATHSRWVIDLNRNPDSKPLYNDGRVITGLCPVFDFFRKSIYSDERNEVDKIEVNKRLQIYYHPYHTMIKSILNKLQKHFDHVVLWDCHSIRQFIPHIRKEKFSDLILGDVENTSSSLDFIKIVLHELKKSTYSIHHNNPFKGGYTTRHYGCPTQGLHALQLEMSKIKYMDDSEKLYHVERANKMKVVLRSIFEKLIERLMSS